MPKRTNDFQELVALIEQALAPKGAKITESAEIKVDGLETLREVDVLVEGQYGPYHVKVAIEAKDHKRKIELIAFDSFLAKYRGQCRVNVDKIVLVSRAGFTEGVIEKANKVDVELLTLDQAKNKDWANAAPGKSLFKVAPHICSINFDPPIEDVIWKKEWKNAFYTCKNGHDHGNVLKNANCLVFHNIFASKPELVREVEEKIKKEHNGNGYMDIGQDFGQDVLVQVSEKTYAVRSVKIRVHFVNQEGVANHCVYERISSKGGKSIVHHIQGIAGNKKLSLLIPGGPTIPEQIVLRIDDADKNTAKYKRERRKQRNKKKGKPK